MIFLKSSAHSKLKSKINHHVYAALFINAISTCLFGMNGKQPIHELNTPSNAPMNAPISSASVPAADVSNTKEDATSLPITRTRVLTPVYRFTSGKPNFYFSQRDLKPGEQAPVHSIKIHTPRGNVFYVEAQGPTTESITTDHKLWHLILHDYLRGSGGYVVKGFLRNAQGVAYTGIECHGYCASVKVLIAKLTNGSYLLFDAETGKEIGALRNAQGVAYTGINSLVEYISNNKVLEASFTDRNNLLFNAETGQEIGPKVADMDWRGIGCGWNDLTFGEIFPILNPDGDGYSLKPHVQYRCDSFDRGSCYHIDDTLLLVRNFFLVTDPVKNFGLLSWQKVLFLMMANHGLLQKYFIIDSNDKNYLEHIYTSIPECTRTILQYPPHNLPTSFFDNRDESRDNENSGWLSCTLI